MPVVLWRYKIDSILCIIYQKGKEERTNEEKTEKAGFFRKHSFWYAQAHVSMKLPLVAEVRQGISSLHTKVSW